MGASLYPAKRATSPNHPPLSEGVLLLPGLPAATAAAAKATATPLAAAVAAAVATAPVAVASATLAAGGAKGWRRRGEVGFRGVAATDTGKQAD